MGAYLGDGPSWLAAVRRGDTTRVKALIATHGRDWINGRLAVIEETDGLPMCSTAIAPLYIAARSGHLNLCTMLIKHGADPNACAHHRVGRDGQWQQVPLTPLDAALDALNEGIVKVLLAAGANPDGAVGVAAQCNSGEGTYARFPVGRVLLCAHDTQREVPIRLLRMLLARGANPNRIMALDRWIGTPLAFAWRVLGSRSLCKVLVSHSAELFTDDLASVRGAIRGDGAPYRAAVAKSVLTSLAEPNRRYHWGVPLSAFAFYTDAAEFRAAHLRYLIESAADPTLAIGHTLFSFCSPDNEELKCLNLNGLCELLGAIDDPRRIWPSGKTLSEAWEACSVTVSLSKGAELIRRAADGFAHIGFNPHTDRQRDIEVWLHSEGFTSHGAWGMVKRLCGEVLPGGYHRGVCLVAQFLHDKSDSLVLWIENKLKRGLPERLYERRLLAGALIQGELKQTISELVGIGRDFAT